MTLYLNPAVPWSDAGRAALVARYGRKAEFCAHYWSRSPFDLAIRDLSPMATTRFYTGEIGERDHDSPALAAAVTLLGVSESAVQLCGVMSDISELGICAGWENGLEDSLWRYIESDAEPHPYAGLMDADDGDRELLRRLRSEGGVWWVFDSKGNRAVPEEVFRSAFEAHGRWPDREIRVRATVANILEDGWDRGLHAFDVQAACPCADCTAKQRCGGA